ncbi:glycoside hydrolase family 6 protein [Streptomyces pactum]|uniref:glycoside hydrolase family 6 protein n=1 Tax=Streptomyces pactum TaxID=68249 RepID=UPI0036FCFE56
MAQKGKRKFTARPWVTVVTALLAVLPPAACSAGGAEPPGPGDALWVDPESRAAREVRRYEAQGRDTDAELLSRIADEPVAEWIGQAPRERARAVTVRAARDGRVPVLVAYHIPYRDCGNHSAGGARGPDDYRVWIRELAAGIGHRPAIVVLEPDAVAQVVDGCVPAAMRDERLAMLKDAVLTLSRLPATRVYLDAGNAGWIQDLRALVAALRRGGVGYADGFALNVSNFQPTAATRRYGHRLARALGGAHFVIDTSRNGNGPVTVARGAAGKPGTGGHEGHWCNPSGRALGEPPTTRTGDPLVDAYLWVKRPGESDGTCNGGPPAGAWWREYALELARNSDARSGGRPR